MPPRSPDPARPLRFAANAAVTARLIPLLVAGLLAALTACGRSPDGSDARAGLPDTAAGGDATTPADARATDTPADAAPDGGAARTLTLMTFNLRTMFADDGINRWENRRDLVFAVIAAHAPDVFGVQEGWKTQLDEIAAALPEYVWTGLSRQGNELDEFSAVFYRPARFTLADGATFWLSPTPEVARSKFSSAQLFPRIVTWVRLAEPAGDIVVLNTHFDTTNADEVPEKSAALLAARAGEAAGALPVFAMGDFNEAPTSRAHGILSGADTYAGTSGMFADPWDTLDLPETGTSHGYTGVGTVRIDWILYGNGATPTSAGVDRTAEGEVYPSDHFPVFATFTLPPATPR